VAHVFANAKHVENPHPRKSGGSDLNKRTASREIWVPFSRSFRYFYTQRLSSKYLADTQSLAHSRHFSTLAVKLFPHLRVSQ
jgi:hypothetical protein